MAFLVLARDKLQCFARLSWQDTVSGAEEDMVESSSAARDGGTSQLPQAAPASVSSVIG